MEKRKGFTIVQTLAFFIIISVLASLSLPYFYEKDQSRRVKQAQKTLTQLHTALLAFKEDNGFYPTTEQSLKALIEKPLTPPFASHYRNGGYMNALPSDPWGNAYIYRRPGHAGPFDLYCYGADGKVGGKGIDADLTYRNKGI